MTISPTLRRLGIVLTLVVLAGGAFHIAGNSGMWRGDLTAGNSEKIGRKNDSDVYVIEVTPQSPSAILLKDETYVIVIPNDDAIASQTLNDVISIAGGGPVSYFGYQYSTGDMSLEKDPTRRSAPAFDTQFPGTFFRSEKAALDPVIMAFEDSKELSPVDASAVNVDKDTRFILKVFEDVPVTFDIASDIAACDCALGPECPCATSSSTSTSSSDTFSSSIAAPTCGDGVCNGGESNVGCDPVPENPTICEGHVYCPQDCGDQLQTSGSPSDPSSSGSSAAPSAVCGDNVCNGSETSADTAGANYCPVDCPALASALPTVGWSGESSVPYDTAVPGGFNEFGAGVALGKMWVVGGIVGSSQISNKVFAFANGEWSQTGTLPEALYGASVTEFQNEVWVIGGTHCGSQDVCFFQTTYHSPDGVTWTAGPSLPANTKTYNSATFVLNDKLFVTASETKKVYSLADATSAWQLVGTVSYPGVTFSTPNSAVVLAGKVWIEQSRAIYASTDGATWQRESVLPYDTKSNDGGANDPYPASFVLHANKLVLVGNAPDPNATVLEPNCFKTVQTSADGVHWAATASNQCWVPNRYHIVLSYQDKLWLFAKDFAQGNVFSTTLSE